MEKYWLVSMLTSYKRSGATQALTKCTCFDTLEEIFTHLIDTREIPVCVIEGTLIAGAGKEEDKE